MIQEYLIKDEATFNLIEDYSSEKISQKVKKIKNIQVLVISMNGENEDSAKKLSQIHEKIVEGKEIIVLSNGCSEYFNKSLFPIINEFERKLRKLLYLAATLNYSENINGIENIKNLEKMDLGEIFTSLFTDKVFNDKTRALKSEISWQYSKKWFVDRIELYEEKTLWGQLIGNKIIELSENFVDVKDERNDIMHAHDISYARFKSIKARFNIINDEIDKLIKEFSNPERENIAQLKDFNIKLSEVLGEHAKNITDTMNPISEQIEELRRIFSETAFLSGLDEIRKILSPYSDLSKQLFKFGESLYNSNTQELDKTDNNNEEPKD